VRGSEKISFTCEEKSLKRTKRLNFYFKKEKKRKERKKRIE
jgi:hypothetical protein